MATHILVVDDETAIADLVEVYLKNEGFTIHKFYNASDALACVRTTRLNLAVLDVMLPDMDGFTLCQRIREDHLFPIIMLTAKVEDMDKIMGLTLGADDYITKPFNPLELVARVKTQLRRYTRYNPREGTVQEVTEYDFRGLQISKATHKCCGRPSRRKTMEWGRRGPFPRERPSAASNKGEAITVTVKGFYAMEGYRYKDAAELKAAARPLEGVGLAWVDADGYIKPIKGVVTDEDGQATFTVGSEATGYLVAQSGDGVYALMNPSDYIRKVAGKPVETLGLTIRSQADNAYLQSMDKELEVASNTAEKYGFTDKVEGVSVLDVLVAAHELVYGDKFTPRYGQAVSGH